MEELIFFHDHAMIVLVLIIRLVLFAAVSLMFNKFTCRSLVEAQGIEIV
jgi:hypothetical protein